MDLRGRQEWKFFGALPKADRRLTAAWWSLLVLRGLLPAAFALAMGVLVGAVQQDESLTGPLVVIGVVFVALQVLAPIHIAVGRQPRQPGRAWLYDELDRPAASSPPGIGHLEDPELTSDLTMARDFDLGITGPAAVALDGLHRRRSGRAARPGWRPRSLLAFYAWWAPLVLAGAWLGTHWLLRESAVWKDRNTERGAGRAARRRLRLPAGGGPAGGEGAAAVRAGRLDDRPLRRPAHAPAPSCSTTATRLRERPVLWCLLLVLGANVARVLVAGRRRVGRAARPGPGGGLRAGGGRHAA